MAENAVPNIDPADTESLTGIFRAVLKNFLMGVEDMLPATVIAYDPVKNVATVHPQIMMLNTDNQTVTRAQFASIPVFSFGGGGLGIRWPLLPGDLGWIKANDNDISLYLQSMSEQAPNTVRQHTFKDGVFFPDTLRQMIIDSEDLDAVVLQLFDNSSKLAIHRDGKVVLKATDSILTLLPSGVATLACTTSVTIDTPITTLTGDLKVDGDINCDGTTTSTIDVVGGGISLKTHVHSGVVSGPSDTGPPV